MSVREFDATDDILEVDDGGIGSLTGTGVTFVVLAKQGSSVTLGPYIGVAGVGDIAAMMPAGANLAYADTDEFSQIGGGITNGTWKVYAVTCAGGASQTPRMHHKALGSGSWTHTNGDAAVTIQTGSPTLIRFGDFVTGSTGLDARIAFAAIWRSVLSDGQIEGIDTNHTTAYVVNTLAPFAAWDFNQAAVGTDVLDLVGSCDQVSRTGTTVIEGDDPTWTFGLASTSAVEQVLQPTVGGRW